MLNKLLLPFVFFSLASVSYAKKETKEMAKEPVATQEKTLSVFESKLTWKGFKKIGEKHEGSLKLAKGQIVTKGNEIVGGEFIFDLQSIENSDIPKDSEYNAKLVNHLKSEDFFDVSKYPQAKFVITSAKKLSGDEYELTGKLTIKDQTFDHTIKAKISWGSDVVRAEGSTTVDRTKYGIKYGSANFFKLAADKIINNEFELSFQMAAK